MPDKKDKNLQDLIERHLQGLTTQKEDEQLLDYFECFQSDRNWDQSLGDKDLIKNSILNKIMDTVHESNKQSDTADKGQIFSLGKAKHHTWYAAAAIAVLLMSVSVFVYFKNYNGSESSPVIQSVSTGENFPEEQVVLTLEDGSSVALGQDNEYTTGHARSYGDSLVYQGNHTDIPGEERVAINELYVPRGKNFTLTLSDGTRLWLNSDSRVKYPVKFTPGRERIVELVSGEAYLDVSPSDENKGTSFAVETGGQRLTVLGTEFNIKAYGEEPEIVTTLVEGKVEIRLPDGRYYLQPSDQLRVNKSTGVVEKDKVNTYGFTAWKSGIFSLESMPLSEVMQTLSRWYEIDYSFENPNLKSEKFSGVIRKSQNIETVVKILNNANPNIRFTLINQTIEIK